MTVIDLLTRVDAICQKYDKYDVDKLNGANVAGDDPFARLYASVDADINQCVEVRPAPAALPSALRVRRPKPSI
jgi:syntaxin of plants SYP7